MFRSYTAPPPSSDPSTHPLQSDWYLFFDIEDSPFDSVRARGQSAPIRPTKRAADEHKEQSAFGHGVGCSDSVMDQRGVLFYNVVGAGQPQKQKLPHQRIALSSITSVLLGKQSALLLHPSLTRLREDCCFSLALVDGRELCFSSKSPIMLVSFLMALKRLMAANCMDEDVLCVRAVIRRGLIDGVLTAALTPSNSQLHPSDNSSASQPSSPRTSVGGLLLPPAQARMGRVSPTHVRSRSQNTAVLFKQLADVSYPPVNAPIRSLSPLPVQSRTTSPRRPSAVKGSGSESSSTSATSTSSSSAASPAVSALTSPSPAALPPSTHASPITSSVSSLPALSTTPTSSAPPTPHYKPPPLSSLLSPGDPTTKFSLLGRLGQGRSGIVYKALYRPLSTHVAIKILSLSPTTAATGQSQQQSSELIAAEVDLLSRSASDYMVGYVGCWRKGQDVWVVQEYMVGGSLSDFMLISAHTLLELEVCAVMHHTLLALQLFHSQRRIHRDVKASNILLNAAGQAKLSDVGTAIQLSPHHIAHTSIGSPYWMAPEVLSSDNAGRSYDEKADIWSLGITALELAYGDPPHHNLSVHQVMRAIVERDPPRLDCTKPAASGSRWSDEFGEFVVLCLQKEPSKRPSAAVLLQSRFIRRMELEEATEVLSAMWRAWGERIEAYRAMEVEIEQKQQAQLASDVKRAEQQRRQQTAAQLSGFDMDGVGVCRMGPSDWNANDVEYSVSSSQPRYSSHHSRSISPSSSSGNHRLHSQSGDREPISPSFSSRRTGVTGGAISASSDRGSIVSGGGGGGSSAGVGKMARSMSFSASYTHYGVRDADGEEEEGELESRKEEEDEEEVITVIDYQTPSHANRTPRKQRPPVPPFPRLSPTSSSSSPPSKPNSSASSLPSPTQSDLARASSFPTAHTRRSRGRLDSYDVDEDEAAVDGGMERSESGGSSTSASRSSAGGGGRRDILYTAEFSSRSGDGRYGGGAEEEEVDGEGEVEGEEFSRQFVEEGESEAVVGGSRRTEDAMTAEEEEELEEAYRAVINYSQ